MKVLTQYSVFSDMIPATVLSPFATTVQRSKLRLPTQSLLAWLELEPVFLWCLAEVEQLLKSVPSCWVAAFLVF